VGGASGVTPFQNYGLFGCASIPCGRDGTCNFKYAIRALQLKLLKVVDGKHDLYNFLVA
jgi:hypothetical protein